MTNLDILFKLISENVYLYRKQYVNSNGKYYWYQFKFILELYDIYTFTWLPFIDFEYIKQVMSTIEYVIDGYGNKTIIEGNHFLIQTVRIPTIEKPCIRKLLQIALNIGQYRHFVNDRNALSHITIDTLISSYELEALNKLLPINLHNDIVEIVRIFNENHGIVLE